MDSVLILCPVFASHAVVIIKYGRHKNKSVKRKATGEKIKMCLLVEGTQGGVPLLNAPLSAHTHTKV